MDIKFGISPCGKNADEAVKVGKTFRISGPTERNRKLEITAP